MEKKDWGEVTSRPCISVVDTCMLWSVGTDPNDSERFRDRCIPTRLRLDRITQRLTLIYTSRRRSLIADSNACQRTCY